jgi:hypothetical protein
MSGIIGGVSDFTRVKVWNTSTLAYEALSQIVVNTGSLSMSGTVDLTKIGGSNVGTTNALYVQPGTGATFPVN